MCGCKNKCNCNITSTTKGEKGDASSVASLGYKVYVALLTQTGTSAPTPIVLANTLGYTPSIVYDGIGLYHISLTGALFTKIYTPIQFQHTTMNGGDYSFKIMAEDDDLITITTRVASTDALSNDKLPTNTPIEIRVYP